jgi:hypothetical protein
MLAKLLYKTCLSLNQKKTFGNEKTKTPFGAFFIGHKYCTMANNPPPYSDITGISRTVMKDNAQASITDYNGNARPSEIVVNQTNQTIYVGNASGSLTQVIQVTGANVFLGNVRPVADVTGLKQLYFDPATGEIVYHDI